MEINEAKRRARRAPAILLAVRIFSVGLTFVSTITVARLVGPREYGLANMSLIILSFAQIFRDFGLTNAVLRKGHIDQGEMSLIFWFNVAATGALAILIAALAPLAADFYNEPIVLWTTIVSLVGFVGGGLALQHRALMNRDLRFGAIGLVDAGSLFAGFLVTLALAILWGNVWAIVLGQVVQAVGSSLFYIRLSGWRPGRPRRTAELGDLLRFGANTSVYSIATFISQNAAAVLIGRFFGSSLLGQFNRAQALYAMPTTNLIQPIAQATMPLLTRLRAHPDEYRAGYLGLVRKLCAFLMPLSVTLFFAAPTLVQALLGDRWHVAGAILAALAPALAGIGFAYAASDLFITQNRSSELRTLGLIELVLRLGGVAAGVPFGVVYVALGFSVSTLCAALLRLFIAGKSGPVTRRDQLTAASAGMPMLVGAGASAWLASEYLAQTSSGDALTAGSIVLAGGVGAFLAGWPIKRSRDAIAELAVSFGARKAWSLLTRRRQG